MAVTLATTAWLGFTVVYACGSALLSTISLFVEDPLLQLSANTVSFGGCAVILYKLFSKDFISLLGHFSSLKDCLATVLDWIAAVDKITTKKEYSVLFDSLEGEWVKPKQVKEGETVERPSDPSRRGYRFAGWYRDSGFNNYFSFYSEINADLTLYARWSRGDYTVTFEANGGSAVNSQRVDRGSKATPPTSRRSGYVLAGWYKDRGLTQPFSFYTPIMENITLYAKWNLLTDRGDLLT